MLNLTNYATASNREPIDEFIDSQSVEAQARIDEAIGYFRQYGFQLGLPFLRRMAGTKDLWELRITYRSQQYRIFVGKIGANSATLLHAIIKKSAKTPQRDIRTAEKRLRQMRALL